MNLTEHKVKLDRLGWAKKMEAAKEQYWPIKIFIALVIFVLTVYFSR